MSHTADIALIGIGRLRPGLAIGVDIEALRAMPDAQALASRHFTTSEQEELAAADHAERDLAFLRGWTRKEACLKAVGSGLSISPSTFGCGLAPVNGVVRIPAGGKVVSVEVASIEFDRNHVAAVAVTRH